MAESIRVQSRCIAELDGEVDKLKEESDLQVLAKSRARNELLKEAMCEVDSTKMQSAIPQLKQEDELACLVNIILPKRLRPQMLSNTAAFQFRKQQTQD